MPFNLSETFILSAEQSLGAALPASYRQAMLAENGGELQVNGQEWEQYPIADTSDKKRLSRTSNHIIKEILSCRGWVGFPQAALAIAGNGAGDQLVLLKKGNYFSPAVYVWSHEARTTTKVANDFSELKAI